MSGARRAPEELPALAAERAVVERFLRLGLPIYRGGGRAPYVALTFDDGPTARSGEIVDILESSGVRATFFTVGEQLALRPDAARREAQLGTVGNHSWTHAYLTQLERAEVRRELAQTTRAIEEVTAVPVSLYRPPYGTTGPEVRAVARALGLLEVNWSLDSRDLSRDHWSTVVATVVSGLRPGAIILMHQRPATVAALPQIIAEVSGRGLQAVTVPELLLLDPPSGEDA